METTSDSLDDSFLSSTGSSGGWGDGGGSGWGNTSSIDLCADYSFDLIIVGVCLFFTIVTFGLSVRFYQYRSSPALQVRQPHLTFFCVFLVFISLVVTSTGAILMCDGNKDPEVTIQLSIFATFMAVYALWVAFLRSWRMLFAWKMSNLRLKYDSNGYSIDKFSRKDMFWWKTYKYLGSKVSQPYLLIFIIIMLLPSYLWLSLDLSNYYNYIAITIRYNIMGWMGISFIIAILSHSMNDIFSLSREIIAYIITLIVIIGIYMIVNDGHFEEIFSQFSFRDLILIRNLINVIRNSVISLLLVLMPQITFRYKLSKQ